MKERKVKKLSLSKESVSNLNETELKHALGGAKGSANCGPSGYYTCDYTVCGTR